MQTDTATNTQESPLAYLEMGTGFLIGLSLGYVLKKSFKLMLLLLGVSFIALFYFESNGFITINEAEVSQSVAKLSHSFQDFISFIKQRLELFQVSKGISAIAGFVIGLKIG
jgi:uncharacterized membrane protein (Fun14 family)